MHILIPEHVPEEVIQKVKAVSGKITISRYRITSTESVLRRAVRYLAGRVLSYNLYLRLKHFFKPRKVFHYEMNGQAFSRAVESVDALFLSWDVNRSSLKHLLGLLPGLKWVHLARTGTDHIDIDDLKERGILLTKAEGVHSDRIAEFVIACLGEVTKRISSHVKLKERRQWETLESVEIKGKTVGILGTGSIGQAIARRLKPYGVKLYGYNRPGRVQTDFDEVYKMGELLELLKCSDFIIICLPLTDATRQLIGERELAVMKTDAYIFNVGRSDILREDALINVLKEKRIKGAVLDVFHPEMQLPIHPYYKMDNVLLTHYSSYASNLANSDLFENFIQHLKDQCHENSSL